MILPPHLAARCGSSIRKWPKRVPSLMYGPRLTFLNRSTRPFHFVKLNVPSGFLTYLSPPMHILSTIRPPLARMADRMDRTLSAVTPPPRSRPVCTLFRSPASIPYEPKTMPGCVPLARVVAAPTPPGSLGKPLANESPPVDVESTGLAAESVGASPVASPGAGSAAAGDSGEGLSLSLLLQPATSISVATEIRRSHAISCNQF